VSERQRSALSGQLSAKNKTRLFNSHDLKNAKTFSCLSIKILPFDRICQKNSVQPSAISGQQNDEEKRATLLL
jgi:hypothetical protein